MLIELIKLAAMFAAGYCFRQYMEARREARKFWELFRQ